MQDVFSGIKDAPYWWDAAPRPQETPPELPAQVDALIIGGGFTGLTTARILARAGRSVLVCEAGYLGCGASTRNGGMLGPSFHKLGVKGLIAHYGKERTHALLRESVGFVDFIKQLTEEENIDCEFHRSGRFRCATKPSHYETMSREIEELVAATGIDAEALPKARVREEIGSDLFYGGIRYRMDGGLHPGKYHDGLVQAVVAAGGTVAPVTEVTAIARSAGEFLVTTSRGIVKAGQIAICTNGYSKKVLPWFRRRVLPIRSSIIATEPLDPALMQELMPARRMYGDSRRIQAYYRPSPDGERIIFGGRATSADNAAKNAVLLRHSLLEMFPQLEKTRITHSWSGLVAYAFDHVPHLGQHDDLYYAMGYCGSGVARASYFGTKLGHKMLGNAEEGACAFDDLPFESRPFYTGKPWFMPAIIRWHRLIDNLGF
jgi:glycine/D-amino acid oxidase-like deaminating enzyme